MYITCTIIGMSLLTETELSFVEAVSRLAYCNPFLPERIAYERQALGPEFVETGEVWHVGSELDGRNPNVPKLNLRVEALAEDLRGRLLTDRRVGKKEARLYRDLVIYLLYNRYEDLFNGVVEEGCSAERRIDFFGDFREDFTRFFKLDGRSLQPESNATHLFACFFQVRRAFKLVFRHLVGGSMPAARLRAAVWQSIFSHDMRRYRRSLYEHMGDITTLVTGPTGTGKELVARAVGMARYIPFDAETRRFAEDFEGSFYALNLSALSPTLIESELFGHRRGAFTGALEDRPGWLEVCPPLGTVFLDEIGEVDPAIQVKLLRVLQTRVFQRLGEAEDRKFQGKIIAATNRSPEAEMRAGRLREDFYYRLCSDLITTPSLAEQLADSPEALHQLVCHLAQRIAGQEEADALAAEVEVWVDQHLGNEYPWPGNVRELEQCVRNVMIRGEYRPQASATAEDDLGQRVLEGTLTADELLTRYIRRVYERAGSYQQAARRLGLDRRTVKARVTENRSKESNR
jgi:transcriptional regulator with AAA-type ATPase domain